MLQADKDTPLTGHEEGLEGVGHGIIRLAKIGGIDSLWLSAPAIAKMFGLDPMATRRRLERWAAKEDVSVLRDEEPRVRKPKLFYDLCKCAHLIRKMQLRRDRKRDAAAQAAQAN